MSIGPQFATRTVADRLELIVGMTLRLAIGLAGRDLVDLIATDESLDVRYRVAVQEGRSCLVGRQHQIVAKPDLQPSTSASQLACLAQSLSTNRSAAVACRPPFMVWVERAAVSSAICSSVWKWARKLGCSIILRKSCFPSHERWLAVHLEVRQSAPRTVARACTMVLITSARSEPPKCPAA